MSATPARRVSREVLLRRSVLLAVRRAQARDAGRVRAETAAVRPPGAEPAPGPPPGAPGPHPGA